MKIYKPIIIIGIERSGTTLLYSILANNPELYWFSHLERILPKAPGITSLLRRMMIFDNTYTAIPGAIAKSNGLISPSECNPYWKNLFKYGDEANYLIEDDYFDEQKLEKITKELVLADLQQRLTYLHKKRLLLKQPGFALKIRYLNALFPDAIFLHTIRNPFDNMVSLVKAKVISAKKTGQKFWGTKIPGWKNLVEVDFSLQAALQIKSVIEIIEKDVPTIENFQQRYLMVKYENLLTMPIETITKTMNFCGLDLTTKIYDSLSSIKSQKQQAELENNIPKDVRDILAPLASKYGW